MMLNKKVIEQVAYDEAQQDWSHPHHEKVFRDGFTKGANWAITSLTADLKECREQLAARDAEVEKIIEYIVGQAKAIDSMYVGGKTAMGLAVDIREGKHLREALNGDK